MKLFAIPLSVSIPSILIHGKERALYPLVALHRLLNLFESFHLNFDIITFYSTGQSGIVKYVLH